MKNSYYTRLLMHMMYAGFVLLSAMSCQSSDSAQTQQTHDAQQLQFQDYPNLKLGFTTQNFLKVMRVTVEHSRQLIDYASDQGYAFIELRDPDASLSLQDSEEIAAHAKARNIEVIYAIQKGVLDTDFWSAFQRGVKNAAVFEGPRIIRSLVSGAELTSDEHKKGWTREELSRVVQMADSAAALARENGLQYVIENGAEPFFGHGQEYYGIADVLSRTDKTVGWQFDTANPFSVSRTHSSPDSIRAFLDKHVINLYYIHLKSSQQGEAQPRLTDNPLPLQQVLQLLSRHDIPYVAIELQAVENQEQAFAYMEQSIAYLEKKNLILKP